MRTARRRRMIFAATCAALLAACATPKRMSDDASDFLASDVRVTRHDAPDDLVTAGLGLEGLRAFAPPAFANPDAPTPQELRRRAFHQNWRGIAAVYDTGFALPAPVQGREYSAFARLPGARGMHRVLAQVPDDFDAKARCLVVTPVSGSRGMYGSVAVAGPWALPKGCAVAYTDKGAGSGLFDFDTGTGVTLDGTRAERGAAPLEFDPGAAPSTPHGVAFKHAHGADNSEADWGRHTLPAARFGLHALDRAFPALAPFTPENTRIIAFGLSNGGGAVLRASEQDDDGIFDAVVAVAPNVLPPGTRPLYDFATEAALLQPCALLAQPGIPQLLPEPAWRAVAQVRCASLAAAGLVQAGTPEAQAGEALARLREGGLGDGPLVLGGIHTGIDLWRAIVASYAQSYTRADAAHPACGYRFAMLDAAQAPRASTAAERAAWWSDATGVAPTAGIAIVDANAKGADPAFASLQCARALFTGDDAASHTLRASIEATRASAKPRTAHIEIVHGADDSLVPVALTSAPYVVAARANGIAVAHDVVPRAQHFDAFLALPPLVGRYVPLLPRAHAALDRAWAKLAPR